jgi:hypothetical protein
MIGEIEAMLLKKATRAKFPAMTNMSPDMAK